MAITEWVRVHLWQVLGFNELHAELLVFLLHTSWHPRLVLTSLWIGANFQLNGLISRALNGHRDRKGSSNLRLVYPVWVCERYSLVMKDMLVAGVDL